MNLRSRLIRVNELHKLATGESLCAINNEFKDVFRSSYNHIESVIVKYETHINDLLQEIVLERYKDFIEIDEFVNPGNGGFDPFPNNTKILQVELRDIVESILNKKGIFL